LGLGDAENRNPRCRKPLVRPQNGFEIRIFAFSALSSCPGYFYANYSILLLFLCKKVFFCDIFLGFLSFLMILVYLESALNSLEMRKNLNCENVEFWSKSPKNGFFGVILTFFEKSRIKSTFKRRSMQILKEKKILYISIRALFQKISRNPNNLKKWPIRLHKIRILGRNKRNPRVETTFSGFSDLDFHKKHEKKSCEKEKKISKFDLFFDF
jgi:hypothetical protein